MKNATHGKRLEVGNLACLLGDILGALSLFAILYVGLFIPEIMRPL